MEVRDNGLGPDRIKHDGFYTRARADRRYMLVRQIWRAEHDSPGDSVEFYQGQCRRQLVSGGKEHRAAAEFVPPPAEIRASR
jgi:hypothetical protein